jgi:nucleotide-binding universal stress UspA family protein
MALYLARHGARVELSQRVIDENVGSALLSAALEYGSDLIVMGGFGHSRTGEFFLGGVTRTMLDTLTLPVLLAH